MNKSTLFMSISILLPTLIACTPDQINSAIEACKGDPSCYEIIDEAIEEELSSRGITGGKMTNVEMNKVYSILNEYQINYEKWTNDLFLFANNTRNSILFSERETSSLEYFSGQITPSEKRYYELQTLNDENKQLFLNAGQKFILYKIGNERFKYEIWGEKIDEFLIDTSLEAIYFNGNRLYSLDYILGKIISNQYQHQVDQDGKAQGAISQIEDYYIYSYTPTVFNGLNIISAFNNTTFSCFSIRINNAETYPANENPILLNGLSIIHDNKGFSFEIHQPFSTTLSELKTILLSEEFATPYSPAHFMGYEIPANWQEQFLENFIETTKLFEDFESVEIAQTIFSQNLNSSI